MKATHTPGPWGVLDEPGHPPLITAWNDADGSTDDIAEVFEETTQSFANARLIAAAPELLAALRGARDFILGFREDEAPAGLLDEVKSAIAKATRADPFLTPKES